MFPSKKSRAGHIGLSGLEHAFRNVVRKLEIPDALELYCARHTFGTIAMAETKNPGLVKEVMGHESLTTDDGLSASRTGRDQSSHRSAESAEGRDVKISRTATKKPQLQEI